MAIDAVLKLFKTFKLFLMKSLGFKILFEKNVFRPWTNFSVSLIISYLSTSFRKINTTSKNIVLLYAIHYDLLIKIDTNITGVFFKLRWFFSFNCKTNGNYLKKKWEGYVYESDTLLKIFKTRFTQRGMS